MNIETKDIPVNKKTMKAEIDATDSKVIYIVDDGKVQAIPLPPYGILELPCQNYKVGNPAYKITIKRN
ncbi:hypothetical protein [Sporosarcina cyprini]|uniref:hypothetical protein n=1 Tax=Sporosarcina cyprini TaxID=2910523 RepID=UPI001EE13F9D|nr:hypothetical protein [Sporosarcina cyprini]MCG3089151.1 hypothetical protein [Sporosarcina cyprini]